MDLWFRCLLLYLAVRFGNCSGVKEYRVTMVCPEVYGSRLDTVSSVASPLGCAAVCQMDERCISAYYENTSRTCDTNSKPMDSSGDTNGCSSKVAYLALSKHNCVNNTDCTGYSPKRECADGFCQCLNGYSWTPATGTCTTNCTTYGDTFRLFPSTSLKGVQGEETSGLTFDTCMRACIESRTITCRTFMLNDLRKKCFVSAETAYLQPQAVNASDPEWTLAQRNCA